MSHPKLAPRGKNDCDDGTMMIMVDELLIRAGKVHSIPGSNPVILYCECLMSG